MSSPAPTGSRNIRILKRDPVQTRDPVRLDGRSASVSPDVAPPGSTTEEEYAKARALIFGDEATSSELHDTSIDADQPFNRSTGKAQYRGCDNSEYDPDYQRLPPTCVPDHYAPESAQRQSWDSRFPTLSQSFQPPNNYHPQYPRNS